MYYHYGKWDEVVLFSEVPLYYYTVLLCSIYQAVGSDIKECTGILSPSQFMSLYISAPQNGATTLAVTLTGDSRALSLEVAGRWLQLFKSFVSESTLL